VRELFTAVVVDISNVSGTVVVTGWDRPEVSVRASWTREWSA